MSERENSRASTDRKFRGSSQSPRHSTVLHLESLLKERDEKIMELMVQVHKNENLLEHRQRCVERLEKERYDLRCSNAQLVYQLNVMTRRNGMCVCCVCVCIFTPAVLQFFLC